MKSALRTKAWKKQNPEKLREQKRRYAAKHPRKRRYNAESGQRSSKAYRSKHPEASRRKDAIRRSRIALGGLTMPTEAEMARLEVRQKGKCYWCTKRYGRYHVDHVWPLSKGGRHSASNLVLSCAPCNLRKGAKTPMEFAGRLL